MAILPEIILASQSSARAGILRRAGLRFETLPANIDEEAVRQSRPDGSPVDETAGLLAQAKAGKISAERQTALVIGADQMLTCDGRSFDKPVDMAEARDHLQKLRGRSHHLVTAACLIKDGALLWSQTDRAALTMRDFSDVFLDEYLAAAGADILTSVGAYKLEGMGSQLFSEINGDYFSILGLPLLPLLAALRQEGVVDR